MAILELYNMPFVNVKGRLVGMGSILKLMKRLEASDLYLKVGEPVTLKIASSITRLQSDPLSVEQLEHVRATFFTPVDIERFNKRGEVDLVHSEKGSRYRVHVGTASTGDYVVVRRIAQDIRMLDDIGLPEKSLDRLKKLRSGLVMIAGATGQGKTVTAVALLDHIARTRPATLLTLEDPIEYIFENHRGLFIQREVGMHVESFSSGIRSAMRENLDVIYVGEMRTPDTIEQTLKAAEMGHLVITTIHADDSVAAIGRVLGSVGTGDKGRLCYTLSSGLSAIITQHLLPGLEKEARVLGAEVLFPTPAIRSVIRSGELSKMGPYIGMPGSGVTYKDHLRELLLKRAISEQTRDQEMAQYTVRAGGLANEEA